MCSGDFRHNGTVCLGMKLIKEITSALSLKTLERHRDSFNVSDSPWLNRGECGNAAAAVHNFY